ncbi:MAG: sugar ABC transporter permease [Chloroflexi bacterium]|nr:MAG: sugar ABC transporter permease [Chloroflexota bacterium]
MNVKHDLNANAHDPTQIGLGHVPSYDTVDPESQEQEPSRIHTVIAAAERRAGPIFLLPSVLALLFLSVFPLITSLYVSLARFKIARGGFTLTFVGLDNYKKLFLGSEQTHFLGAFAPSTPATWIVFSILVIALAVFLARYLLNARVSVGGLIGRLLLALGLGTLAWIFTHTLWNGGRLGTVTVTIVYVFVGIFFQYIIGLGLAMLTVQNIPGRRFFRVVFLLPMMITPVGVAYMFRMLTDTSKGPFTPIWQAMGLTDFSWVNNAWGARTAILIADIWQWTPFMFIVLVAALESQSVEPMEAATVDGANQWQIFRHIVWPGILPVSMTLILIRLIEAFKIIDLPNVMTNGGPGTATQSLTYHAFINWRGLDVGGSAAVAYMLLFLVTFFSMMFVNLIRQQAVEKL